MEIVGSAVRSVVEQHVARVTPLVAIVLVMQGLVHVADEADHISKRLDLLLVRFRAVRQKLNE